MATRKSARSLGLPRACHATYASCKDQDCASHMVKVRCTTTGCKMRYFFTKAQAALGQLGSCGGCLKNVHFKICV